MTLGHLERQALHRMVLHLFEVPSRVSITEVIRPATKDLVDVLHDHFNRYQQATPDREFTYPAAHTLHRFVRGPAARNITCRAFRECARTQRW